jgi:hypothetical protein
MRGISSLGKERIKQLVENLFNKVAIKLLGNIPSLRNKNLFIDSRQVSLANIFVQAMNNRPPNLLEEDVLKGLLASSYGYMQAIKYSTQSNVVEQIDGLIRQSILSGSAVTEAHIQDIIAQEFKKANTAVKMVAESETTKVRNVGSAVDIARVAGERGIEDPNVFFIVRRDKNTCQWCLKNHLMDGGGAPKVFKLSEVRQSYLSTEQKRSGEVSVCGQHPLCRCTLGYLSPGYGFKNGKIEFIKLGHDEYTKQKS